MGITTMFKLGKAAFGLFTGDPVLLCEGLMGAVQSYATGILLEPITEPLKEMAGEVYADTDWVDVIDSCPTW